MDKINILLIDDDAEFRQAVRFFFLSSGDYDIVTVDSGRLALRELAKTVFDVVICDMSMPDMDGLQTMRSIQSLDPHLPVIIVTGVGTIENAVESIHGGAFHYITKPFNPLDLEKLVQDGVKSSRMNRHLKQVEQMVDEEADFVVGYSQLVRKAVETATRIAEMDEVNVLIVGEAGTGKSTLAKLIHSKSLRREKPYLHIHCGTLSETLLEEELFGVAESPEIQKKLGIVEQAYGGTLFLEEIGDLSPTLQLRLLHMIQNRSSQPQSEECTPTDVRIISTTSRDLSPELEDGRFSKDLFFRLAIVQLQLPPLRQRLADIILFLDHFINKFNKLYGKKITLVQPGVVHMIASESWAGNIAELENAIKRAVLLAQGDVLKSADFSSDIVKEFGEVMAEEHVLLKDVVQEAEKVVILKTLNYVNGNKSLAAKMLGISRPTLYEKLEAYGFK